ncbi:Acetyltransferase involved in cellulose biosynthesis, CelD/BcsL family [Thermomonospora echinospora]|uniref:Acetyltransferase involved in cellulose biosynthesis, CelD/BcsL family n=1 Tax=Thermomonospora echinospora TaxID=1992 RepID=A0A1H5UXR3_9ACTN|nr:GNAT family N-acetyltransferase [Thermomonospora echinospora]SEF79859.1 Acetyltransferase involved in cellulose biosynthesis, CelD/BcsL family [Thermomonospora echinospora]
MKITVIRPAELGASEIARWREIQQTDPELGNPFLAPEFTLGVARFRPRVRVAVVEEGDKVTAFFPYERGRAGIGHPVGFGLTDLQGIIAPPDLELDARRLLKECRLGVWDFNHLLAHQSAFAPFHTVRRVEPVMDLRDGFEAFITEARNAAPKTHKTVRYKERKLAREVGEIGYVFDCRDEAELTRLMAWKSDQYNRTGRTDRFARPWIVELVRHFHRTGFGVLSILYAGQRPVSAHFGLRDGAVMAGWFPAYDTRFAKYSPGMIGHLRLAQGCAEAGITEIAMGRGGKEFKEGLKGREIPIAEGRVALPLSRHGGGAALHWVRTAPLNRARTAALGNRRLYDLADRALRTYARLRPARTGRM